MSAFEISREISGKDGRLATVYETTKRLKAKSLIKNTRDAKNEKNAVKHLLWLTKVGIFHSIQSHANKELLLSNARKLNADAETISFLEFYIQQGKNFDSARLTENEKETLNVLEPSLPIIIKSIRKIPAAQKKNALDSIRKNNPDMYAIAKFFIDAI